MYVRWVVRKHKNSSIADVAFHDAYLVESYRDEKNNPRQRMICYLGNVRQIGIEFPAIERELFFLRAERILQSVTELEPADRERVLEMLREKMPRLSDAEVLEAFRNTLRWYYRWWYESYGGPPPRDLVEELIRSADQGMGPM